MNFQEKVTLFRNEKKLNLQELAEELGLNYIVMNRNIRANKITIDFISALVNKYPEIDLNWLMKENYVPALNEPGGTYRIITPVEKVQNAISILKDLEVELAQK